MRVVKMKVNPPTVLPPIIRRNPNDEVNTVSRLDSNNPTHFGETSSASRFNLIVPQKVKSKDTVRNLKPKSFFSTEELSFLKLDKGVGLAEVKAVVKAVSSKTKDKAVNREANSVLEVDRVNTMNRPEVGGIPVHLNKSELIETRSRFSDVLIDKKFETHSKDTSNLSPDSSDMAQKSGVSLIIPKPDLKAIVSQDSALKHWVTTARLSPAHNINTSPKPTVRPLAATSTVKPASPSTSMSSHSSTLRTTTTLPTFNNSTIWSTTQLENSSNTVSPFPSLQTTPSKIPLMVGGGLAIFIIILLIAIVVLLLRIKNRKGVDDIATKHNSSSRSNLSKETVLSDIQRVNSVSGGRRESTESNVYSEIGSELGDEEENEDEFIYYWGESEWDSDSRHNSVISLSYSTKAEMARNSNVSIFGVPKRGRRKSSLANCKTGRTAQNRFPGCSVDMRKDRQSGTGDIFCIPEDVPIEKVDSAETETETKKDDMYKKVRKESRSQSLF